jgi:hypothetical protein
VTAGVGKHACVSVCVVSLVQVSPRPPGSLPPAGPDAFGGLWGLPQAIGGEAPALPSKQRHTTIGSNRLHQRQSRSNRLHQRQSRSNRLHQRQSPGRLLRMSMDAPRHPTSHASRSCSSRLRSCRTMHRTRHPICAVWTWLHSQQLSLLEPRATWPCAVQTGRTDSTPQRPDAANVLDSTDAMTRLTQLECFTLRLDS